MHTFSTWLIVKIERGSTVDISHTFHPLFNKALYQRRQVQAAVSGVSVCTEIQWDISQSCL